MAQVKFYSVSASDAKTDAGGIYFVTGGELYKGTSRFGANKVWTVPANTEITGETAEAKLSAALTAAGVTGAIGGDILTGYGAAKVFNGTTWVDLGQDQAALDTQLSGLVSGLAFNGEGSYITGITQGADGKVTASTSNFATDVKAAIGNGAASSTANGITVSVTTTSGSVTDVQVDATNINANSGTFTDLTVTSTATFSATTVSATTLTIGGSTVEQIADARISNATLTGNITAPGGTDLVNEGQVVTYVSAAIQSFDNAMHYIGITETSDMAQGWTGTPTITGKTYTEKKAGDIVLMGTQEYIWNGSAWELIGDQGTYATKAELSSLASNINASWSSLGTAAFVDTADTVTAAATTLPTCSAVASYVASYIDGLSGSASDSDKGITVEVVTGSGRVSSVDVSVDLDTALSANADNAPTTKAVYDALCWLDASGFIIS